MYWKKSVLKKAGKGGGKKLSTLGEKGHRVQKTNQSEMEVQKDFPMLARKKKRRGLAGGRARCQLLLDSLPKKKSGSKGQEKSCPSETPAQRKEALEREEREDEGSTDSRNEGKCEQGERTRNPLIQC